jgi:hypothetical protein
MRDSIKRRIELRTPTQHMNGTWNCMYVIFEFGSTRWRYNQGAPDGSFASRVEAAAAALLEAKRILKSLEVPARSHVRSRKFGGLSPASLKRAVTD